MAQKELTHAECMEIFKKYDPDMYRYYSDNAWFFGYTARNYAGYLKEKAEGQPTVHNNKSNDLEKISAIYKTRFEPEQTGASEKECNSIELER